MALVMVKGRFMGANLDKRSFEGVDKYSVLIDLYQKDSPIKDKSVQIKTDDLELQAQFNAIPEGTEITMECTVNAYRNDAYFKLHRLLPVNAVKTA